MAREQNVSRAFLGRVASGRASTTFVGKSMAGTDLLGHTLGGTWGDGVTP